MIHLKAASPEMVRAVRKLIGLPEELGDALVKIVITLETGNVVKVEETRYVIEHDDTAKR
jgi:hypothetical protein